MSEGVPVACNMDCGGGCPLLAHVEGGSVTGIVDNPLGGAHARGCVRGYQYARVQHHEDRLTAPLIRTGPRGSGEFREASWGEALGLVADTLSEVRERHGAEAVLHLGGSGAPRGSLHNTARLAKRFLAMFGGYTERRLSYSTAAATFATPYVLGTTQVGLDPGSLERSSLIILWGANVVDNRFGSELESRVREARARGVRVVAVEPRATRTVKTLATDWVQVLPGTDQALMLAVLHVLVSENLVDRGYVARYCYGFERLEEYVLGASDGVPKTPGWASPICGTPEEQITWLARLYGGAHPTALIPGLSIQRTIGGEEAMRLSIALQAATGNVGVLGGSSGGYTSGTMPAPRVGAISVPENPKGVSVPTYTWPDAVLEGRKGGFLSDIRAIYSVGGNYLVQGSDIHKNIRAFQKAEFTVIHDRFLTPTAHYCDVVLPVTTFLERNDIVTGGGNFILYSNRVLTPLHDVKNDYDIFCELARCLGFLDEYSEGRDEEAWLREFVADSDVPDLDEFRRTGILWGRDQRRVAFTEFIGDPEGHPLDTPSGRIQLSSERYAQAGGALIPTLRVLQASERYPLRLITPKSRFRVHSQNYNIGWFRDRERQALWINPDDAAQRGIAEGDTVRVTSPQGVVAVEARVTGDIMRGVVCLHEGAWPAFDDGGVELNGSANILTSTEPTLPSHGSRTHSVLVQAEKA